MSTADVERLVLDTCVRGVSKSGPASASSQEKQHLDFKILVEPPLLSATITDLCNEPLFYNGDLSSEEEMSSDDSSLSSIGSVADDFIQELETNFPELLAEDCSFVEQQCNQAEAVVLKSPGKPKMVRVSKVDLGSAPVIKKQVRNSSRLTTMSLRAQSQNSIIASSSPKMPSTPELEAGSQTPESSHGPATPDTPASAYFDALTSPSFEMTPTPKTRLRNPYRLRLSHMSKRPESYQPFEAPLSAPLSKPKLMARGAGERMPSLDLPPYPLEQPQQPTKSSRPWILRRDSASSTSSKDVPKFRLRRAESGILPGWR